MSGLLEGPLGDLTFTPDWSWWEGGNPLAEEFPSGWSKSSLGTEAFDFTRRWHYTAISGKNRFGNEDWGILITDIDTMQWVRVICGQNIYDGTFFGSPPGSPPFLGTGAAGNVVDVCCGGGTDLYMVIGLITYGWWFIRIEPESMKIVGELHLSGQISGGCVNTTSDQTIIYYHTGLFSTPDIYDGIHMVRVGAGPPIRYDDNTENLSILAGKQYTDTDSCDFIIVNSDWLYTQTGNIDIWVTNVGPGYSANHDFRGTVNVSDLLGVGTNTYVVGAQYDPRNDQVLMLVSTYVAGLEPEWLVAYDYSGTGYRRWVNGPWSVNIFNYPPGDQRGNLVAIGDGNDFNLIDTETGMQVYGPASIPREPLDLALPGSFYHCWDSVQLYFFTFALAVAPIRIEFTYRYQTIIGPPPSYLHFLTCCDRAIMAHLYQITSATGLVDYFTDFDVDLDLEGKIWKANSLRFEGLQRKVSVGISVDEQTLKIWASPSDTIFGATFLTGVEEGLLDGAIIVRKRVIWEFVSGNVAADVENDPLFAWTLFTGYMGQVVKGGVSHVEFKVKSAMVKLNVNMPRNYYQPGCLWTLFDQGCTLSKPEFGFPGTVGAVPNNNAIAPVGGINPAMGPDGIAFFAQGRLLFVDGPNNGLQVLIDANTTDTILLAYPLNTMPNVGDNFVMFPGCSKSYTTCSLKFNNAANFRGFDKVPPVMISI